MEHHSTPTDSLHPVSHWADTMSGAENLSTGLLSADDQTGNWSPTEIAQPGSTVGTWQADCLNDGMMSAEMHPVTVDATIASLHDQPIFSGYSTSDQGAVNYWDDGHGHGCMPSYHPFGHSVLNDTRFGSSESSLMSDSSDANNLLTTDVSGMNDQSPIDGVHFGASAAGDHMKSDHGVRFGYTSDYNGIHDCWYSSDGKVYDQGGNCVGTH